MSPAAAAPRPKVLFFAPVMEFPAGSGGQISVVNAVTVLNEIAELHIVTTVPVNHPGREQTLRFFSERSHALLQAPSAGWYSDQPFLGKWMRRFRRLAAPVFAAVDARFVMRYADAHGIRIFWIDRVLEHAFAVFDRIRRARPNAGVVADTCAVFSRFVLRELPLESHPLRRLLIGMRGRRKLREEHVITHTADVVTAVSELDAQYFRSIATQPERVKLFSNVIDHRQYLGQRTHDPARRSVLLLGAYGHPNSPMDRAAKWMAEEVMPLVWRELPDAHLHIVGRNADKTQAGRRSATISVVGHVPSVMPYLKEAALTVVPLRYESGTRFKILESGAASIPCVSTVLGAEGIAIVHDENIVIADTADEFAAGIVRMLKDPEYARRLGAGLHQLIVDRYSLFTQKREGEAILRYLEERSVARSH